MINMIDNVLPVTNLSKITYSKLTLGDFRNKSRNLEFLTEALPFVQNRFDSFLSSFYSTKTKPIFITKFDDFSYEQSYDTNEIFSNSLKFDYNNSVLYKQRKQKILPVVKLELELLFDPMFMDEDFWFNNTLLIPTKHYDKNTNKRIALKIKHAILESASFTIVANKIVKCNVSILTCFVDKSTYEYSASIWRGYDVFGNWYSVDEYQLKSCTYNKTSNVIIHNKKEKVNYNNFLYVFSIYDDKIEKYNAYIINNSLLYQVDDNLNFYITQTVYNETFSMDMIKDFEKTDKSDLYEFIVNTRYRKFKVKLFPDVENRKSDTIFSSSGKGVLEWL